jgi:hypothetical protein
MTATTMRLRYAGVCTDCSTHVAAGVQASYDRATRSVRCSACVGGTDEVRPTLGVVRRQKVARTRPPAATPCADCGRRVRPEDKVLDEAGEPAEICRECVLLDVVHVIGLPGGGARAEHARRVERRETRVRTRHPRLGGLILALTDDPRSTQAWAVGAHGEEAFGAVLSGDAGPGLKVLHDRKRKGSDANIDHLAVTTRGVWVLDTKRWSGRIETRGGGLLSRREPDLYVGGRDRTNHVLAVRSQVEAVREALCTWRSADVDLPPPDVHGALVFVDGDFGWFASPTEVRGIAVTWGKQVRSRLREEVDGPYPAGEIAKHLASALRSGLREPTADPRRDG